MKINLVLNHIIRILLVFLLCIMLFIGSIFVIPPKFAFADSVPDYSSMGISYTLNNNTTVSGTTFNIANGSNAPLTFTFTANDTYYFSFSSVIDTNVNYKLSVWNGGNSANTFSDISDNGTLSANSSSIYFPAGSCSFAYTVTTITDDTSTATLRFNVVKSDNSSASSFIGTISDFNLFSASSGGSPEPRQAIVTIEPGYVAYIGVSGGSAIFTATFNKKQPKGSITSNIRFGFSSSRPPDSSTITMDSSVGSMIPFVTDRPFDIWGKSFNGRYGLADLSASYLIVYVPLTDPDGNTNATVKVALSEYLNAVQFPLSASMVGGDIVSTGNSDEFYISDSSMLNEDFRPEYVYSNSGITSTAISIPVGGNNLPPSTGGGSLIEQFTSLLSDLINRIESLLIAPVEYIKWIISSSSNFMAWLSAIWTWLPEPVYTTIVSVLLILVVVGALKLLWR